MTNPKTKPMTIGVLGGGQLARMLARAGAHEGHRFRFLDSDPHACAHSDGELITGPFEPGPHLDRFADGLDAVTSEFERVPAALVEHLQSLGLIVRPGPASLRAAQDRLAERTLLRELGIDTPRFASVETADDLRAALERVDATEHGAILKARVSGYDGKGQAVLEPPAARDDPTAREHARAAFDELGGTPAMLDERVRFDRELSVIAARAASGAIVSFPLAENRHEHGILRTTVAPAPDVPPSLERTARDAAGALMERLDHVGVLALEFFQIGDRLLANEFAPRVHNSGHWSIEGASPSQFEAHLACVLGREPAVPTVDRSWAMANIIGEHPAAGVFDAVPGASVHLYGKPARPGRKLGHVTAPVGAGGCGHDLARQLASLVADAGMRLTRPG